MTRTIMTWVAAPRAAPGPARPLAATVGFACAAMPVSYLPFSAANGVLGILAARTGATTDALQWVPDAFAVTVAATVLPAACWATCSAAVGSPWLGSHWPPWARPPA